MSVGAAQSRTVLDVGIEIAPDLPDVAEKRRELEVYLKQYAADLWNDLKLPEPFPRVRVTLGGDWPEPHFFRLRMNGRLCPVRQWPEISYSNGIPVGQIAATISAALHANRTSFIDAELARTIAQSWGIREGEKPRGGWSEYGFQEFLRVFVHRNFSIARGGDFAKKSKGISTKLEAERGFEQAISEATELQFGTAVLVRSENEKEQLADNPKKKNFDASLQQLTLQLGLVVPGVKVETDASLEEDEFRVRLNDVRLPRVREMQLEESGTALRWNAGSFLISHVTQFTLDRLKREAPDVVRLAQERLNWAGAQWMLTSVLRELLDEQVSIRDLRSIIESFLYLRESQGDVLYSRTVSEAVLVARGKRLADLDASGYATCVRLGLKSIATRYTLCGDDRSLLPVLQLDEAMEQRLLEASQRPLEEDEQGRFRLAVGSALQAQPVQSQPVEVILCSQENRRRVRELTEIEFPALAAISREEIPGVEIQIVRTVSLPA